MQPAAASNTRQPTPNSVQQLGRCASEVLRRQLRRGGCQAAPALLEHPSAESAPAANSRLQSLRLITAIKTPYLPSGRFDLRAFDRIVENQVQTLHAVCLSKLQYCHQRLDS
jgi:diphthamide biosynthesis methyltransferase